MIETSVFKSPLVSIFDSLEQSGLAFFRHLQNVARKQEYEVQIIDSQSFKALNKLKTNADSVTRKKVLFVESLTIFDKPIDFFIELVGTVVEQSIIILHHVDFDELNKGDIDQMPTLTSILTLYSTSTITISSLLHVEAQADAQERARPDPVKFDLKQSGILIPLGSNSKKSHIKYSVRRKSGRSVVSYFTFDCISKQIKPWTAPKPSVLPWGIPSDPNQQTLPESTFNLNITDQQRSRRTQVDLPYLRVQQGQNVVFEYELEEEDDFDPEEDEL